MLRTIAENIEGARILDASSWFLRMGEEPPLRLEETFVREALKALEECTALLVDDYDRVSCVFAACDGFGYPRKGLHRSALLTLTDAARDQGKKLVFASTSSVNDVVDPRCLFVGYDRLELADYEAVFGYLLGERLASVDMRRVFDFAPRLTIHQMHGSLQVLKKESEVTTERVITYLEQLKMASNMNVANVRDVALEDLKGVDDVIAGLKRHVITPLVEEDLARRYAVRPKRGILLLLRRKGPWI